MTTAVENATKTQMATLFFTSYSSSSSSSSSNLYVLVYVDENISMYFVFTVTIVELSFTTYEVSPGNTWEYSVHAHYEYHSSLWLRNSSVAEVFLYFDRDECFLINIYSFLLMRTDDTTWEVKRVFSGKRKKFKIKFQNRKHTLHSKLTDNQTVQIFFSFIEYAYCRYIVYCISLCTGD